MINSSISLFRIDYNDFLCRKRTIPLLIDKNFSNKNPHYDYYKDCSNY